MREISDGCEGGIALACVGHIIAARVEELKRKLQHSSPDKSPGRKRYLETLQLQMRAIGTRLKNANSPDLPPLTILPFEHVGALCSMAAGDLQIHRPLRDAIKSDIGLEILEILELR